MRKYKQKVVELSAKSDVVIIDHYSISPFAKYIDEAKPIIYNSYNCETDLAEQLYPAGSLDIRVTNDMERAAIESSKAFAYCSDEDLEKINKYFSHDSSSYYVPNGTTRHEIIPEANFDLKTILFTGSGHPPNTEAANILIQVAKEMPDYNFVIAGSVGDSLKSKKITKNVKVTGYIDNKAMDNLFKSSSMFINPMQIGSGTHLKMTMAMGYGLPIISTTVGARGFTDEDKKASMLIAESKAEIIEAIKKLENKKIYNSLRSGSYSLSDKYSWDKSIAEFKRMIKDVLAESTEPVKAQERLKVLVYSIIRNEAKFIDGYYNRLRMMVKALPNYEFYLSLYENDSTDGTKQKLLSKDWSFFAGVSIISEDIKTKDYGSVKDEDRVKNLSIARNKAIEAGGFLKFVDYILMIESDMIWDVSVVKKIFSFKKKEPDFDIVSGITIRNKGLYDSWATRKTPEFIPNKPVLEPNYRIKAYDKYYSTSNGLCLYRAEPFREGVRYGWINTVTKEADCDTVVVCQYFHERGYSNIYILHDAEIYHEHF